MLITSIVPVPTMPAELTTELDGTEEVTADDLQATPTVPGSSAQLTCGYDCLKYNKPHTRAYYDNLTPEKRDEIKTVYYESYDFMTGIRTAEFLGGAILLFSLFVLYKMKCRPGGKKRKMSVIVNKMAAENSLTLSNPMSPLELTSSPDTALSEPINEKDSGCQNGSAGSTTLSWSRRGSQRLDMPHPAVHHNRLNAGRMSCGNITGPLTPFQVNESLLRPSSVQCGLHQPSFYRRPVHLRTSDPSNELIDIQIIQATPNASPRGNNRRLSEGNGGANSASNRVRLTSPTTNTTTAGIPKSQSCLQTALSSGRTGRKTGVKSRRLSLSPADCYLPLNRAQYEPCSFCVIPNSPSTPSFVRFNSQASVTTSSNARRLSGRSFAGEELVDVHRSSTVQGMRRASAAAECHVSWLPVASRLNPALPLDVNCVLLENEDQKISETRC